MPVLSAYVSNIVYFVLFATFVGIIAPHSKYKQYINMMLGLVLIILVAGPVRDWLGGEVPPVNQIFAGIGAGAGEEITDFSRYEDMQLDMVRKTYNQYAEKQIHALLSGRTRLDIVSVEIIASVDLGEIQEIYAVMKEKEGEKKESGQRLIRIEPVRRSSPDEQPDEPNADEIKSIKKIISDFYNLSADNIHITME